MDEPLHHYYHHQYSFLLRPIQERTRMCVRGTAFKD